MGDTREKKIKKTNSNYTTYGNFDKSITQNRQVFLPILSDASNYAQKGNGLTRATDKKENAVPNSLFFVPHLALCRTKG